MALRILPEPVDVKHLRQLVRFRAEAQPVSPVVGHVVTAEGQHRHGIPAHHPHRAGGRGGGFRGGGSAHEHPVLPIERLEDQRRKRGPPPAEQDRRDRHALGLLHGGSIAGQLGGGEREAGVGMGRRAVGAVVGGALPIGHALRRPLGQPLPPGMPLAGQSDVGEDGVPVDGGEHLGIGVGPRAWRHAEDARLGIDRPQPPVVAQVHPGDVLTDRPDLVALMGRRRVEHRQVRLAAGGGEGGGHVMGLPGGRLDAHDQHVLRQPALPPRIVARQAQGVALLAEQGVAAVAGADALDGAFFREVQDVAALGAQIAGGVQPLHELAALLDPLQGVGTHPRHDAHARRHVCTVGDFHARAGVRRGERPHHVGHDIQGAPAHAAREQFVHQPVSLAGRHPIVGGAGVFPNFGADECQVFGAGDVGGVGAVEVAAGVGLLIEGNQLPPLDHPGDEAVKLRLRPVAPVNPLRLGQPRHLADPSLQLCIRCAHPRSNPGF